MHHKCSLIAIEWEKIWFLIICRLHYLQFPLENNASPSLSICLSIYAIYVAIRASWVDEFCFLKHFLSINVQMICDAKMQRHQWL